MWETRVQSPGREDLLEKEMATHSTILAWKIPLTEKPGRLQLTGLQRVRHDWATSFNFTFNLVKRQRSSSFKNLELFNTVAIFSKILFLKALRDLTLAWFTQILWGRRFLFLNLFLIGRKLGTFKSSFNFESFLCSLIVYFFFVESYKVYFKSPF